MAPSSSPISISPRRVDPRTREILQGENARTQQQRKIPTRKMAVFFNHNETKTTSEKDHDLYTLMSNNNNMPNAFPPYLESYSPFYSEFPNSIYDLPLSYSSPSSSSSSLSNFLDTLSEVHRVLIRDDANPIVASSASGDLMLPPSPAISRCSSISSSSSAASLKSKASSAAASDDHASRKTSSASAASSDDRAFRLHILLREAPWELNADFLRRLKSGEDFGGGGVPAWNLGQIIRAALLTAHCIAMEEIKRVFEGAGKNSRKWSVSSASSTASAMSTSSSAPLLTLQDFNWTDHGYPLMEALGLEEAAAKFDDKFEAMRRYIDEAGEKGMNAWREALRMAGVEEEEEVVEEQEEEQEEDSDHEEKANEADDYEEEGMKDRINEEEANDENDKDRSDESPQQRLMLEVIEVEARNHATILYILKAIEKLMI